jgi:hypothetical protein
MVHMSLYLYLDKYESRYRTVFKSDTTSAATIDRRHAMQLHTRIDELLSTIWALVSHRVLKQPP